MKKRTIQRHHPITEKDYEKRLKDYTLPVTKGEHAALSRIQWFCRGEVSTGFIQCLKIFIALNELRAIDLEDCIAIDTIIKDFGGLSDKLESTP